MIDGRRGRTGQAEDASPSTPPPPEGATGATGEQRSRLRRFAAWLAGLGVTADHVTVAGLLLAAVTGVAIALGHMWTGIVLVSIGGLMDTLDGAVAKEAGSSSKRGAFFDSVSDRVADALIFGGVAWFLAAGKDPKLALLPLGILAVSNVISYERAKAESLGYDAKGGMMERAERLILLCAGFVWPILLVPVLCVLLFLCVVTAVQRFVKVWRQATASDDAPATARSAALGRGTATGPLRSGTWRTGRVESRWREFREARAAANRRPGLSRASRSRARRRPEPLSTRLRRVLESERAGARTERAGSRAGRPRLRRPRDGEGATAALRRRLGTGR
ncbi:MAG: CDP-alcohol phosphatidyltransferase family protein [Acidimicrobiales bacterium]